MKISTSFKSLLLCAAAFTSFSAYAQLTGTETEKDATIGSSSAPVEGISIRVDGTYNAGGGGSQAGDMTSKGFKMRTGADGNRCVFSVNAPYTITSLELNGIANYTNKEGGDDVLCILVTKVEVDGIEVPFEGEGFPQKGASYSSHVIINDIAATESITLYFDNSNASGTQVNTCYVATWAAATPDAPTISGVKETLKLIPGATTQLTGKIDYPDTFTASWISEDESIATVDVDGVVTAVAPGTTTISYAWDLDQSINSSCEVTVTDFDIDNYDVVATWDFTTMGDVTLEAESAACGNVWNDSNAQPNAIYRLTNPGLTQFAVQAVLSGGKGWAIVDGTGLKQYTNRCAAIMDLVKDQVVEIIYTGSGFYTKGGLSSKGLVIDESIAKGPGDGAEKEALNEGVGRAIYKMLEDGLLGFELAKDQAVKSVTIYTENPGGGTGIESLEETVVSTGVAYDLMGRRAADKGLMIRDGKVIMVK